MTHLPFGPTAARRSGDDGPGPARAPLREQERAIHESPDHFVVEPTARRATVYVHFPWCLAKCPYCDFVSYVDPRADSTSYTAAVLRELEARAPLLDSADTPEVESIFFGGGTPSLWDARELAQVVAAIRNRLRVVDPFEITVECNPTSLNHRKARALVDAGVNRLSIGVQSLRNERLRFLGRLHDAPGAIGAVRDAIRAGVPRVSADLIFGTPGQSPSEACAEAIELVELGLAHVSCYQLTIEAGTRFGELARRGRLPLADEGAVADAFLAIDAALTERGLRHYEVSNYARPGEEARHNLAYWRGDEYLGLGCAAYGFVRDRSPDPESAVRGVRWRNIAQPNQYVASTHAARPGRVGVGDGISESSEGLDAESLLRERIMLGLRVHDGLDVAAAAQELGVHGWTAERERTAIWLQARQRLIRDGARIRIPPSAWLWTDDTSARLF
ncbi:MAG: radical SAM family heme chaperone HemW [Polyangiaceae bacterium]|jgi:oxygen-independent coproporphyrinogen-3 oxidase